MKNKKNFIVTHIDVDTGKLNNQVKIAVLSDLHNSEYGPKNEKIIESVKKEKPDIIAVAGDLMTMGVPDCSIGVDLCKGLIEIAPVYFTMGNHDYDMAVFKGVDISKPLRQIGVHVLTSKSETINVNGNRIVLLLILYFIYL